MKPYDFISEARAAVLPAEEMYQTVWATADTILDDEAILGNRSRRGPIADYIGKLFEYTDRRVADGSAKIEVGEAMDFARRHMDAAYAAPKLSSDPHDIPNVPPALEASEAFQAGEYAKQVLAETIFIRSHPEDM